MTLSRNQEDQDRLITCVRRALQCMDEGEAVDPVAICAEHPHLAGPLAEVLGLTDALSTLQQEALREDPLAGLVLADRYQLSNCLGRGAMGVVYHAEDRELRRDVAVKILDARLFRDDQAELRFQREAEVLAALQHPNVVAVFDRGRTPEGIHFLVMELLEGATMAQLVNEIDEGGEPIDQVKTAMGVEPSELHWPRLCASWCLDLANGLAAAHARQLVHRDIKPSNVFLARPGRPVLLDFGIAARASDERLTATQSTLGTPWYMPPEQVTTSSLGTASPTLDVYGLGATMYHLLCGRPPYEGDAAAVLAALPNQDPTPLHSVQPDLPRDLVAIVEKCLERAPHRRYADARALAADLDAFLAHRQVAARPLTPMVRRLRQWRRAPARPIAGAAVLLAIVIAIIALPGHWQQQAAELQAKKLALYAELPALLAIDCWPNERVLSELHGEHTRAIDQLDALIALDPNDLPVRLWRACMLLDVNQRDAAATDLRAIAQQGNSVYFQKLAKRYAESNPEQLGAMAIDLEGMPAPTTDQERYVAGFHELRNRHVAGYAARAYELLTTAASNYLPARDLRQLAIASLAETSGGAEQTAFLSQLYDESVALEQIYGGPTARTQAMRGNALLMQGRAEESIAPYLKSLEIRPDRHGPHNNLGIALKNVYRYDESLQHLQAALQLHPFAWNTRYTMAQVLRDNGDFVGAYELAEQLAKTGQRGEAWKQPFLIGSIALAEATNLPEGETAASKDLADRAVASFREALAEQNSSRTRRQLAVAEALQAGTQEAAFVPFAKNMLRNPDNANQLRTLAILLPNNGLTAEQTAWTSAILRKLAARKAAGNPALRQRLEAEIEIVLSKFR